MFPKLVSLGDFFLPTYGALVALGFLAGLWVTVRLGRREGLCSETISNLAVSCALVGIAGAKLAMLIFDWRYYMAHPGDVFSWRMLQAGGVFQGGLALALVFAILYLKRQRLPVWKTADLFAPGVALGHGIGRLGCFAAGCCWGVQCDRPWAVTFRDPEAHRLTGVPLNEPLHPTQLYEAFAEAAIFAILYRRALASPPGGHVLGLYLVLYGIVRFAVEFVRKHEQAHLFHGPFSHTQWISAALLVLGVWLLRRRVLEPALPAEPAACKQG